MNANSFVVDEIPGRDNLPVDDHGFDAGGLS